MVYRTEKYQKLKAEVEKQSKKREQLAETSSPQHKSQRILTSLLFFSGEEERGAWRLSRQAAEEEDRAGGGEAQEQQSGPLPREDEVDVRDRVRIHRAAEHVQ